MDPTKMQEIKNYKTTSTYPLGASKQEKLVIRRRASKFEVSGGDLYYVSFGKDGRKISSKVVSTTEEANEIFVDFHASATGAHCGIRKTCHAISQRYYWPNMNMDICKWVSHCPECQTKPIEIKATTDYCPILVTEPWELVGMDLIGKLNKTKRDNEYICTIVDYFTKWTEAFPLKSKSAADAADCIVKFFYKFGAPKRILTDQGREFNNELNAALCRLLNIKRSISSPYHPQTNGLVEKMNGTIQRSLCKLVKERPDSWDLYLDAVLFGLRTKKQMTTQYSPYFLLFGREARYPSEVPESFEVPQADIEKFAGNEIISECISFRDSVLDVVRENMNKSAQKIKNRVTAQKRDPEIKIGDRVMRKNIRSSQRIGGKLDPSFFGPFVVENISGKLIDLRDNSGNLFPKINSDHIQIFKEVTEHIPTQILKCAVTKLKGPVPDEIPVSLPMLVLPNPTDPSDLKELCTDKESVSSLDDFKTFSKSTEDLIQQISAKTNVAADTLQLSDINTACSETQLTMPVSHKNTCTVEQQQKCSCVINELPGQVSEMNAHCNASPCKKTTTTADLGSLENPSVSINCVEYKEPYHCIDDVWNNVTGHVLVSKIGHYNIFDSDLVCLQPGKQLESQVINAHLFGQVRTHNKESSDVVFYIDSYAMTLIWHGKPPLMKKVDPLQYKLLLGVVNDAHHWTLVAIYPSEKRALYLNSLGELDSQIQKCKEVTRAFMRRKNVPVSRWTCSSVAHPKQLDSISCGVFVCKFAEYLLEEEAVVFESSMDALNKYRREIAESLINQSDDMSNLCHICAEVTSTIDGQSDGVQNWIACDTCNLWFHLACTDKEQRPADECSTFLCYRCYRRCQRSDNP